MNAPASSRDPREPAGTVPVHLAATTGAEAGVQFDPKRWASVTWLATADHVPFAEKAALATRSTGRPSVVRLIATPLLPSLLHVLSEGPRSLAVDVTGGPASLSHAAHHAASLLKIECHVSDERGDPLRFPLDPRRQPPAGWTDILREVAGLARPTRVVEIARLTGMGESTVRYHVSGRRNYVGLVGCGALTVASARIEITPLGRAYLERGIVPARGAARTLIALAP